MTTSRVVRKTATWAEGASPEADEFTNLLTNANLCRQRWRRP